MYEARRKVGANDTMCIAQVLKQILEGVGKTKGTEHMYNDYFTPL